MFRQKFLIVVCLLLVGLMFQSSIGAEAAVFIAIEEVMELYEPLNIEVQVKSPRFPSLAGLYLFNLSDQLFSLYCFSFYSFNAANPISVELSKEFNHSPPIFIL